MIENPDKVNEEYTQDDGNKDLAIVYTQTALKVAKVYAPAVILGGLSITAILTSKNILRKRNIALAAAYTAVDKSFKEYRGRVVERFGKELDKELRYNIKAKDVEETVTDEKGKDVKKASQQALTKAREEVGSVSRRDRNIVITDREWEAIQAGAVSESVLKRIYYTVSRYISRKR